MKKLIIGGMLAMMPVLSFSQECNHDQWGESFVITGISTGEMIPGFPGTAISANDISVQANTSYKINQIEFEMYMMTMDASTDGMTFDVYIYNDSNGIVGGNLVTVNDIPFESLTLNSRGNYTVVINLPEGIVINNTSNDEKRYWLGLGNDMVEYTDPNSGNTMGIPSYWVSDQYIENDESHPAMYFNGTNWTIWTHDVGWKAEGNFILQADCEELLNTSDLNKAQFTYYPNPVRDELSIETQNTIKNISVYNMTGQEVYASKQVVNGKVNLTQLPAGTYMVRMVLDNNHVETFKVIRK